MTLETFVSQNKAARTVSVVVFSAVHPEVLDTIRDLFCQAHG